MRIEEAGYIFALSVVALFIRDVARGKI